MVGSDEKYLAGIAARVHLVLAANRIYVDRSLEVLTNGARDYADHRQNLRIVLAFQGMKRNSTALSEIADNIAAQDFPDATEGEIAVGRIAVEVVVVRMESEMMALARAMADLDAIEPGPTPS